MVPLLMKMSYRLLFRGHEIILFFTSAKSVVTTTNIYPDMDHSNIVVRSSDLFILWLRVYKQSFRLLIDVLHAESSFYWFFSKEHRRCVKVSWWEYFKDWESHGRSQIPRVKMLCIHKNEQIEKIYACRPWQWNHVVCLSSWFCIRIVWSCGTEASNFFKYKHENIGRHDRYDTSHDGDSRAEVLAERTRSLIMRKIWILKVIPPNWDING